MNRIGRIALLFLAVIVGIIGTTFAQTRPSGGGGGGQGMGMMLAHIKEITEQLNLTDDQKKQTETLFQKAGEDLKAIQAGDGDQQDKMGKVRDVLSGLREDMGNVLSDEQKSELQQKMQALRGTTRPSSTGANGTAGRGALGGGGPGASGERLKVNLAKLDLTADQKSQADDVLKSAQEQIQGLVAKVKDGSLDRDAAREQGATIFSDVREKMQSILTQEQQEKLRTLMQQDNGGAGAASGGASRSRRGNGSTNENQTPATQPGSRASNSVTPVANAPAVGEAAPDFNLKKLDGQAVQLSSPNHPLTVLVFGNYTSPSFRDKASALESLRNTYSYKGVSFLIVYTRETHPAGGWEIQRNKDQNISVPQPTDQSQRQAVALQAKNAMKLSVPIATDTMDDKTAQAYGVGDGTPAVLVGHDGKILFRQSWLEPTSLAAAIDEALSSR